MGMAASQVSLLRLTSRKHDITYQEMILSNQKIALSRDSQKATKNHQNALSSKVLKLSNNQGVTYSDLTYNNLMTPNAINQYSPYLLTDNNDKVVVDDKYREYAELISPNGTANGDYESNRSKILASITGIDESKINSANTYDTTLSAGLEKINELEANKPSMKEFTYQTTPNKLLAKMGDGVGVSGLGFSSGSNWEKAYNNNATIKIGTSSSPSNFEQTMKNLCSSLEKYFINGSTTNTKFKEAIEAKTSEYKSMLEDGIDLSNGSGAIKGSSNKGYEINVKNLIDEIMGSYAAKGGDSGTSTSGETVYTWYDVDSDAYSTWSAKNDEWTKEYKAALKEYNTNVDNSNKLLSSQEEQTIKFYDTIFSSIAEKGWTFNNSITNEDYLNQVLQNNIYAITTLDSSSRTYDKDEKKYTWNNSYSTDIASNFSKVCTVNDSDAINEAYTEYEYQKSIIKEKETRIDQRMKNLETELSAINQMIQGIESVRNKNIETNMNIFG